MKLEEMKELIQALSERSMSISLNIKMMISQ